MENEEIKKQEEALMQFISPEKKETTESKKEPVMKKQGFTKPVIDEQAIMQLMAGELPVQKESRSKLPTDMVKKNVAKNRKLTQEMYQERFFKIPLQAASKGKSVYLRQEHHQKFSRLISVLGVEKLTIYAYVDNIIEHHFQEFEELISAIYAEKHKPLF